MIEPVAQGARSRLALLVLVAGAVLIIGEVQPSPHRPLRADPAGRSASAGFLGIEDELPAGL